MAGDAWTGGPGAAWSGGAEEDPSTDGFWASYSDLMAGILMIFVLSSVLAVNAAIESSRVFDGFRDAVNNLCEALDPQVKANGLVEMDCSTAAITFNFPDGYEFNATELPPELEQAIEQFIPDWLEVVTADSYWNHVEAIEIAGYADKEVEEDGDELFGNLEVSTLRAKTAMEFLVNLPELDSLPKLRTRERLIEVGSVVGLGIQEYPEGCPPQGRCALARRIVMRPRIDNENVLAELLRVLGGVGP